MTEKILQNFVKKQVDSFDDDYENGESSVDLADYVTNAMDQHIAKSTKRQHTAYVYQV
jgi:hypothetical protein